MATYIAGDGATGAVDLTAIAGGVLYAAGAGDKSITTGDADSSVNTGSGHDVVHLGGGADVVTFGTGASTTYAGAGSDTFVLRPGAMDDAIVGFKGAGLSFGEGVKDFIRLQGFTEGSQLVLQDGAGAAHQSYAVVAADGTVESRFAVDVAAGSDGAFHTLAAGADYVLADSTPAPVAPPAPTPPVVIPDPTPVTVTPSDPPPPPTTTTPPPTDTSGGDVTVTPPPAPSGDGDTGAVTTPPPAPAPTAVNLDFSAAQVGQHGGFEQGFQFSDDAYVIGAGHVAGLGDIASPGLLVNLSTGHSTTLLERPDGLPFSLDSLQIDTAARIVLTGHLHSGGDVSTTFAGSGALVLNWGPVDSVSISNLGRAVPLPGVSALQNASLDVGSRLIEFDNIMTHLFF